jgi:prolyl oligopeptidase
VLLALDFAAGYGIGNTRDQRLNQGADIISFILWQLNEPGFQAAP